METLDQNAMEELAMSVQSCGTPFYEGCIRFHIPCLCLYPRVFGCDGPFHPGCDGPFHPCHLPYRFWPQLTEALKACAGEFYEKCTGLERIEKYCEFEPAIEAAKFKEQAHLDRIAQLEARVKELELKKKG